MKEILGINRKTIIFVIVALVVLIIAAVFVYRGVFGAPQKQEKLEQFTIAIGNDDSAEIIKQLKAQGFIKSELGFRVTLLGLKGLAGARCADCVSTGAYKISKAMNAWELAKALRKPYMKWVVIPEGLRKEQIADIIGDPLILNWDEATKKQWIVIYTTMKYDEMEGLYFPDTYLIPVDEEPLTVADRLRAKFNEKFAPYSQEALKQNIKWDTLLKIASLVQREAAGKDDMPLIAGILWNRLLAGIKLEIDATIQYVRDDVIHYGEARYDKQLANYTSAGSWWEPIKPEDKNIASPYNTYRNKGLPPHPIANPGLEAINAALNPVETKCLYYLHDSGGQIHCSKTYEEHQEKIRNYL